MKDIDCNLVYQNLSDIAEAMGVSAARDKAVAILRREAIGKATKNAQHGAKLFLERTLKKEKPKTGIRSSFGKPKPHNPNSKRYAELREKAMFIYQVAQPLIKAGIKNSDLEAILKSRGLNHTPKHIRAVCKRMEKTANDT